MGRNGWDLYEDNIMFTESLLAAALTLSAWYGDAEAPEAREARLLTIAQAINIATLQAVCATEASEFAEVISEVAQLQEPTSENQEKRAQADKCLPLWHGSPRRLAFLLLTQAYFETRLAVHIHEGKCRVRIGECDAGRATSLWQLHAGPQLSRGLWRKLSGTDLIATTGAAFEAARALSRGRNHCRSMEGAVSLYATGKTCSWRPAAQRVDFLTRLSERY